MSSVVIVRGQKGYLDPTYACLSHDRNANNYSVLHFEDGHFKGREVVPYERRSYIEKTYTKNDSYRGTVYVDQRSDNKLLPLHNGPHCEEADLDYFRRAKSDTEMESLDALYKRATSLLNADDPESAFRSSSTQSIKSAIQKNVWDGFVEYRGGCKDSMGRVSDISLIEPRNEEWDDRKQRVYKGMQDVVNNIRAGASKKELNEIFFSHLDPFRDVVYGSVVNHTGFETVENIPTDTLELYDYVRVGAPVGDATTGEIANFFGTAMAVKK